jgi:hypothetical protein
MLGLAIALSVGVLVMMLTVAPAMLEGGIARAYIHQRPDGVAIPGQAFRCTLTETEDRCQATLQGQPLRITVQYPDARRETFATDVTCIATYSGNTVPCSVRYDFATGSLPIAQIDDTLGWSDSDFRGLRRRYRAAQFTEPQWFRLTNGIILLLGLAIALLVWTSADWEILELAAVTTSITGFAIAFAGLWTKGARALSTLAIPPMVESLMADFPGIGLVVLLVLSIGLAAGLGWLAAVLLMRGAQQLTERGSDRLSRIMIGLNSGLSIGLIVFALLMYQIVRLPIPVALLQAIPVLLGLAIAAIAWWRPQSLGKLVTGLNGGLVVGVTLFYLNLLLLLGLGLAD